jgi:tetratricopeptide (TPR) repeat protein
MAESQPQANQAAGFDSRMQGTFVGRQREMGELKAALEEALSGQGRLVMLTGEPGIGKTRTAQELAFHAEARGTQVLWGWCYEEAGAPPYWPWVQPLHSYIQQQDPDQLRSQMGPGAANIAEIIPEVHAKLSDLNPPPDPGSPEEARFRLFESITSFLKNAAQSQLLVLVLDDLQWADKSSLLLLQFLARQLGESHLLVVGCYRDLELSRQHPLSESMAQLSRLPVFQRELLLGMSQEDTGQFIEMTIGTRPSPQLVETIHAHTEGNPFFLKEMTRLLSERGELMAAEIGEPDGIRMPEGVREVIGQRLNQLSESGHETLTIASVIGREFDFRLLRTLSDETTDEQLLGVIDEALAACLVEELPGGRERYRFSHALIQQTLAEELSSSRKVRWHARIGKALEDLYGVDVEAHAAELVYHFAKAESVLGTQKLVRYSLMAGERALAAYAWEEALEHFQQGLAAKEGQPTDAETTKLLFGLGRAQAATLELHNVQEAVATLSRALDYCAEAKHVNQAVAIAEYHLPAVAARYGVATQLVARALKLVPSDSHAAGRLLSRYGWELGRFQRNHEGAQEAFNQALAIAHRDKDEVLEMWTLARSAHIHYLHCCYEEVIGKGLRSLELANRLDIPQAGGLALSSLALTLLTVGDPSGARYGEAALEISKRLRDRNEQPQLLLIALSWSLAQGDWHNAQVLIDWALTISPNDPVFPTYKGLLACELGDFQQGETILGQVIDTLGRNPGDATARHAHIAISIALAARITGNSAWASSTEALAESVFSTHETPRIFR